MRPAIVGASAPVARPAGGPTACPLRGFPAVLGAGRPANNSPSNRHRAPWQCQARSSNSICGTPLRGATFRPLRSSASHTGRQPASPQGLGQHRGAPRDNPCMPRFAQYSHSDAVAAGGRSRWLRDAAGIGRLLVSHLADSGAPVGRPAGGPCAQPRSAGAGRSRRAAASPKCCLSSELGSKQQRSVVIRDTVVLVKYRGGPDRTVCRF
jgi:hypothetical protein